MAPDAVPLPLKNNHPQNIQEGSREYNLEDKCSRVTAPGKRSWRFAQHLSKNSDFNITLLVPNLNFPGDENIDYTGINFKIKPYNYKTANWEWSEELDGILKKSDFVIMQTTSGTGFQNCAVLPRSVNVIVDGWIPFLAELPCVLLNYHRIYRKINWTKKFLPQYRDVMQRANCVLYANTRQQYHYEGQFFMIEKLDWTAFKFSPLLKVPYGIDPESQIKQKERDDKFSILWYGPVYPWYYPEKIIEDLSDLDNINIDFVGLVHPRYRRIYNNHYRKIFDRIETIENMSIVEDYCDDNTGLFEKYDMGIVLAKDWIEEIYSHRCRILDMVSRGFPVILNKGNSIYEEYDFMRGLLHPVALESLREEIIKISEKEDITTKKEDMETMHKILGWDKVLAPLVEYIRRF